METNEFDFAIALQKLIQVLNRGKTIVDGVIESVDEQQYTCKLTILGTAYSNVPIKVLVGSQASMIEIPSVGSACLVCFRDGDEQRPQLLSVDQVDKVLVNAPLFQFNGGNNGGIVLVNQAVTKINNIENLLNDLIAKYNAHIHPLSSGTSSPTTTQETGQIAPLTQASDIESTVITQ